MGKVNKADLDTVRAAALDMALNGDLAAAADLKKIVDTIEQGQSEDE